MKKTTTLLLAVVFLFAPMAAAAQELTYDRYAAVYRRGYEPNSGLAKVATHFLTYPFELIRWPVNQSLIFTEKHHLLTKGEWLYNTVEDFGFTPKLGVSRAGVEVDFIRVAQQKVNFPDATLKGSVEINENGFFTGGKTGLERIAETPIRVFQTIRYENRPEEHFYGIGPDTSFGEGTSYRHEQTTLESIVGMSAGPSFSVDAKWAYKNINITNGEDGGRGIIDTTFPGVDIPGLDGEEMMTAGLDLIRDTRNQQENSTRGAYGRLQFSFNEGFGNSDARYFKYETEVSKFIRLGSDRRVFVIHFYGEHNDEINDKRVPFHQMAKLGGYGNYPDLSRTLRAYDENRFFGESAALFNFEYRYTVWEYRDWKADTVLFWDEGQVFNEFSEFQLKDFRESYGVGFRVSLLNHVLISLEVAHGDEGTNFYVKSRSPF